VPQRGREDPVAGRRDGAAERGIAPGGAVVLHALHDEDRVVEAVRADPGVVPVLGDPGELAAGGGVDRLALAARAERVALVAGGLDEHHALLRRVAHDRRGGAAGVGDLALPEVEVVRGADLLHRVLHLGQVVVGRAGAAELVAVGVLPVLAVEVRGAHRVVDDPQLGRAAGEDAGEELELLVGQHRGAPRALRVDAAPGRRVAVHLGHGVGAADAARAARRPVDLVVVCGADDARHVVAVLVRTVLQRQAVLAAGAADLGLDLEAREVGVLLEAAVDDAGDDLRLLALDRLEQVPGLGELRPDEAPVALLERLVPVPAAPGAGRGVVGAARHGLGVLHRGHRGVGDAGRGAQAGECRLQRLEARAALAGGAGRLDEQHAGLGQAADDEDVGVVEGGVDLADRGVLAEAEHDAGGRGLDAEGRVDVDVAVPDGREVDVRDARRGRIARLARQRAGADGDARDVLRPVGAAVDVRARDGRRHREPAGRRELARVEQAGVADDAPLAAHLALEVDGLARVHDRLRRLEPVLRERDRLRRRGRRGHHGKGGDRHQSELPCRFEHSVDPVHHVDGE
jgi:hypothetical protein